MAVQSTNGENPFDQRFSPGFKDSFVHHLTCRDATSGKAEVTIGGLIGTIGHLALGIITGKVIKEAVNPNSTGLLAKATEAVKGAMA